MISPTRWACSGGTTPSASDSAYPLIAVSGVRRSCEIDIRNSRWRASECVSAPVSMFIASATSATSAGPSGRTLTSRRPLASARAASAVRRSGRARRHATARPTRTAMATATSKASSTRRSACCPTARASARRCTSTTAPPRVPRPSISTLVPWTVRRKDSDAPPSNSSISARSTASSATGVSATTRPDALIVANSIFSARSVRVARACPFCGNVAESAVSCAASASRLSVCRALRSLAWPISRTARPPAITAVITAIAQVSRAMRSASVLRGRITRGAPPRRTRHPAPCAPDWRRRASPGPARCARRRCAYRPPRRSPTRPTATARG